MVRMTHFSSVPGDRLGRGESFLGDLPGRSSILVAAGETTALDRFPPRTTKGGNLASANSETVTFHGFQELGRS